MEGEGKMNFAGSSEMDTCKAANTRNFPLFVIPDGNLQLARITETASGAAFLCLSFPKGICV